jgi:hypothetical protein
LKSEGKTAMIQTKGKKKERKEEEKQKESNELKEFIF